MSLDRNAPHNQPLGRLARFGDAAHGVYRASTGKITTPADVQIATPGVAPLGGDAHLIRPPGARPDTRTPEEIAADAAAGRTWLDYGIISGINNRVYGKALAGAGMPGWIYCAPDGSRWLARITAAPAGFSLTFRSFGDIRPAGAGGSVVQAISLPAAGLSAANETAYFSTNLGDVVPGYRLDAVSSTGAKVLITGRRRHWSSAGIGELHSPGLCVATATNGPIYGGGPAGGAWEIIIDGTPPAAVATIVPIMSERPEMIDVGVPYSWWRMQDDPTGVPGQRVRALVFGGNFVTAPGQGWTDWVASAGISDVHCVMRPLGSYSYTRHERWLAGGYYDANDTLQLVTPLLTVEQTVVFDFVPEPYVGSASNSFFSGTSSHDIQWSSVLDFGFGVTIQGEGRARFSFSSTGGYSAPVMYSGVILGGNPEVQTPGPSYAVLGGWAVAGDFFSFGSGEPQGTAIAEAVTGPTVGVFGEPNDLPLFIHPNVIRFSNNCWGIVAQGNLDKAGRGAVLAYVSPQDVVYGPFEFALADGPGYATAHPVTGEITASLVDPVCVV